METPITNLVEFSSNLNYDIDELFKLLVQMKAHASAHYVLSNVDGNLGPTGGTPSAPEFSEASQERAAQSLELRDLLYTGERHQHPAPTELGFDNLVLRISKNIKKLGEAEGWLM